MGANRCLPLPPEPRQGYDGPERVAVTISEASAVVGRSPDTLRRWEERGLIRPGRDRRGHRVFSDSDVARCVELARHSLAAQYLNKKLIDVVPQQLSLFSF